MRRPAARVIEEDEQHDLAAEFDNRSTCNDLRLAFTIERNALKHDERISAHCDSIFARAKKFIPADDWNFECAFED